MLRPRVIPCLLLRKGGLVKTVGFSEARYIGDPINAVRIFNEKEADELMVLDIDATAERRGPSLGLIARFATECRMPLCYGGGIHSAGQAREIIGLGVEKVGLSTAAIATPAVIEQIAREVGRQSVVVVMDVRKMGPGSYELWTHNGKTRTGIKADDFARRAEQLGAGEIVINSIDNDGRMSGYDLELAQLVRRQIQIPLTVLGGAGSLGDIQKLISTCGVVGAAAGSLFVYKGPLRAVLINYPNPTQKEDLLRRPEQACPP